MNKSINNQTIELWQAFVDGEKAAFSKLYKILYRKLYTYGINTGMTNECVEDTIQELFIKLYINPKQITTPSTLLPFLLTSLRNSFLNIEKSSKRNIRIDDIESFRFDFLVENNPFEEKEEQELLKKQIARILESLTSRQREIIYLKFLMQMSYEEISSIMQLTEQAARNLTHRAIEKIRKNNPYFFLFL
ncbi:MAG: RNA polymerase sigma factor [Tannerella sp.]|jgi:RNA polymerase sigma factor (sigma-70 family)|nr:RNA polymerase sigma factor [Tannerella sp.]